MIRDAPCTILAALILAASGCPDDRGGTSAESGTSSGTTSPTVGSEPNPTGSLDTTAGLPADPCLDDYDGNHEVASAHSLGLVATEVIDFARGTVGDRVISGAGNEQGEDRLVVCADAPDFFSIAPVCPGYLGIDLRRQAPGALDLYLYAEGQEVARAVGTWNGFYLKPLHRPVTPQTYTIEVRHAGGEAQPYSLDVYLLATAPCG
jgi:hypothetical protein